MTMGRTIGRYTVGSATTGSSPASATRMGALERWAP